MKRFAMIFLVILLFTALSKSQDFKADLTRINQTYAKLNKLSQKISYKFYASHTSDKVLENEDGEFKKNGARTYSKFGFIEQIAGNDMRIFIDNTKKTIAVDNIKKTGKKQKSIQNDLLQFNLDSISKTCKSINFKKTGETEAAYTFKFEKGDYTSVNLLFS
jgi:hypothetical protein